MKQKRQELLKCISDLIDRLSDGLRDDESRDSLLCEVLTWQSQWIPPYQKLVHERGLNLLSQSTSVDSFPAMPTDVFRYLRMCWHPEESDIRVFRTSGTTSMAKGCHYIYDLSLYDRAARAAAKYALFPDTSSIRMLILAPEIERAPDSSLSYMLSRFVSWFGNSTAKYVWSSNGLNVEKLISELDQASQRKKRVAILGTSFAFVHAEERLEQRKWRLPLGSRIMHTGGYKGRSREVDKDILTAALKARYGIDSAFIIQEYGMTELSSQMYELNLRNKDQKASSKIGVFWIPGWVRCTVVDPETLSPLAENTPGLLRIDDLANLDSICSIQTSDMARLEDDRVIVIGRAKGAPPRGCSIAVDEECY